MDNGSPVRLRKRLPKPQIESEVSAPPAKKKGKPQTVRSKEFYTALKTERSEEYAAMLASQKVRSKDNRVSFKKNATEQEKAARREKARDRQKRYREAQKEKGAASNPDALAKKPVTRKEAEKAELVRKRDRERKMKERSEWSSQKRVAEKKKALERYYGRKPPQPSPIEDCQPSPSTSQRTGEARKQAVHRLNQALPRSPRKKQQTLDDFFRGTRSKSSTSTTSNRSLTEAILSSEAVDSKEQRQFKRLLAKKLQFLPKATTKELSLTPKSVKRLANKSATKLRKTPARFVRNTKKVFDFFDSNSRTLPFKRGASKGAKKVLDESLKVLFEQFVNSGDNPDISFSFFCSHRPKFIKPQGFVKFNQALCEICENIDLKLKSFKFVPIDLASNKGDLLKKMMCPYEGEFPNLHCASLDCQSCGPQTLLNSLSHEDRVKDISYSEWSTREVSRGTGVVKRKALVSKTLTLPEMKEELGKFPLHILRAKWQYAQFLSKKNNLRSGELLCVLDFAENYRCSSQDEAQSAHWNYEQVTIHPFVFYFLENNKATTEAVIVVSDDLTHDASAVQVFTKAALGHMRPRGSFTRLIQFSDGCGSQYKSRQPFAHIQESVKHLGMPIERHFFGSRHGKNPSDGEAAVVKSAATRAVKCRRQLIQTPHDLFQFGRDKLSLDGNDLRYRRKFLFVDSGDVAKERQTKGPALKTLVGTRALHVVKASGHSLMTRNLSCFCESCDNNDPLQCDNLSHVQQWQEHDMLPNKKKGNISTRRPTRRQSARDEHFPVLDNDLTSIRPSPHQSPRDEPFFETDNDLTSIGPSPHQSPRDEPFLETDNDLTSIGPSPHQSPRDEPFLETDNHLTSTPNRITNEPLPVLSSSTINIHEDSSYLPNPSVSLSLMKSPFEASDYNDHEKSENENLTQPPTSCKEQPQKEKENEKMQMNISPGSWVLASFPGKKLITYLGVVLSIEGNEANVKFTRQNGKYFTWPIVDDIGWMPLYSLTPIEAPTLDSRERMIFPDHVVLKMF